jgi:hypothetical protein
LLTREARDDRDLMSSAARQRRRHELSAKIGGSVLARQGVPQQAGFLVTARNAEDGLPQVLLAGDEAETGRVESGGKTFVDTSRLLGIDPIAVRNLV